MDEVWLDVTERAAAIVAASQAQQHQQHEHRASAAPVGKSVAPIGSGVATVGSEEQGAELTWHGHVHLSSDKVASETKWRPMDLRASDAQAEAGPSEPGKTSNLNGQRRSDAGVLLLMAGSQVPPRARLL